MSSLNATIRDLQARHKAFVKRVHAFRIPLSPRGRAIAQIVYFSVPIIGGYFIMDWATNKAKEEIQYNDASDASTTDTETERAKVLQNMRISPVGAAAGTKTAGDGGIDQQIARQNHGLQSYLESLKQQQSGGGAKR